MPGDAIRHTPLFTCMLTLSAVVHVSSYLLTTSTEQRAIIRERIALSIGALKAIKNTWALADGVLQNIKMATREVMAFTERVEVPLVQSTNDPYQLSLNAHGPWIMSPQDPLFAAVPELLPPGVGSIPVSL